MIRIATDERRRASKITPKVRAYIREMLAHGWSEREIATALGVSQTRVNEVRRLYGMRKRAAIVAAALAVVSPVHATISMGELMVSDFYRWPDWRENLALYDCTNKMWYFMTNLPPEAPPPVVDVTTEPPIVENPPPCWGCDVGPPPGRPIPEASSWLMFALGMAFLSRPWRWARRAL